MSMNFHILTLILLLLCQNFAYIRSQLNYSLYRRGDLMLGGLFPIFKPAPNDIDKCDDEFEIGQALIVYALVYAIHKVNALTDLLTDINLGVDIKPTCSDPVIALIESIKFIDQGPNITGYNLETFEANSMINDRDVLRNIRYSRIDPNISSTWLATSSRKTRDLSGKSNHEIASPNTNTILSSNYLRVVDENDNNLMNDRFSVFPDIDHHQRKMRYIHDLYKEEKRKKRQAFGPVPNPQQPNVFVLTTSTPPNSNIEVTGSNPLNSNLNMDGRTPANSAEIASPFVITSLPQKDTSPAMDSKPNIEFGQLSPSNQQSGVNTPISTSIPPAVVTNLPPSYASLEISPGQTMPSTFSNMVPITDSTLPIRYSNDTESLGSNLFVPFSQETQARQQEFFDPNPIPLSDQEKITLQATLNFMNKEPDIKTLLEGLGNSAKIISPLMSSYQIPQISYKNSDDNLANKMFYPYLIRFAVSNRRYVMAMVDLLAKFGWTYVNIIYMDEDNSENLYELLKAELTRRNMCTHVEMRLDESDDDLHANLNNFTEAIMQNKMRISRTVMQPQSSAVLGVGGINTSAPAIVNIGTMGNIVNVADNTASNGITGAAVDPLATNTQIVTTEEIRAKVVITLLTTDKIIKMFSYFNQISPPNALVTKDLIFVGTYTWPAPLLMEFQGLSARLGQISALFFREIKGKISDYLIWFRTIASMVYEQEPLMNHYQRWLNQLLTNYTNIISRRKSRYGNINTTSSWVNSTSLMLQNKSKSFIWELEEEMFGLEVWQILQSMDMLTQVFDKLHWQKCPQATRVDIADCLLGEDIYNELSNLVEERTKDETSFGTLVLNNLKPDNQYFEFNEASVGFYYMDTLIVNEPIRIFNQTFQKPADAPLSICSVECPPKHYKIYKSNLCCWECAKCQVNEILTSQRDKPCAVCPTFTWPDTDTQTRCQEIKPQTIQGYTFTYYVMPVFQIIGLFAWAIIVIFYLKNYRHPATREMGRLIIWLFIIGVFFGLIAHFMYFGYPARLKCTMCYFLKYGSAALFCAGILAELSTSKSFVMRNRDMVDVFRNELTQYERKRQWMVALLVIVIQVIFSILLFNLFPIFPGKEQVSDTLNNVLVYCPAKTNNTPFNIIQISFLILLLLIAIYLISREQSLLRISSALRYLSFCIYISLFLCVMMLPINFSMKSFLSRIMFDFVLFIILNVVFLLFIADFAIFRLYTIKTYASGVTQTGGVGGQGVGNNRVGATTATRFTTGTKNAKKH